MVNNRRSELEIIDRILDVSKSGAKKTEILYYSNLSYMQLKSYLGFLMEKNILEEKEVKDNGNVYKLYKPTEKGFVFHNDLKKVLLHLNL